MKRKTRGSRTPRSSRTSKHHPFWKIAIVLLVFVLGFFAGVEGISSSFRSISKSANNFSAYIPSFSPDNTQKSSKAKNSVPRPLPNFHEAKRAAKQIFKDHPKTFYCGCKFDKHNKIDIASCGYVIQQDKRRAKRLEWEHIVPMSHLAGHFACWKQPLCSKSKDNKQSTHSKKDSIRGRRCCQKIDPEFSRMEADLHNLVPEIGELNALRSNYRFGMLPHMKAGQFGQCEMKIDSDSRRVEPNKQARGVIARAYLYMADTYDFQLSNSQQQLFSAWNTEYPPEPWEIEWDNRVFKIQGNHNAYIAEYLKRLN